MAHPTVQTHAAAVWELVARQHGVVTRWQLLELGMTADAIRHRVRTGRLRPIRRGVYAVGRPELTQRGWWMAAVLSCGPEAALSHESAAALWGFRDKVNQTEISVPARINPRPRNLVVHRRCRRVTAEFTLCHGIPITSPVQTLVDVAVRLSPAEAETAINEADRLDLVHPDPLREALITRAGQPGVPRLRSTLDRRTFALTRSELERRFLPIARRVGLPKPRTRLYLNGFEVDFYWPELRLVIETDGLRYHRTQAQQARDRVRDQAHQAAGDYPVRFTHAQVRYEPAYVEGILRAVIRNLRAWRGGV